MAKARLGKGLGALFPTIPEEKSPVIQPSFDSDESLGDTGIDGARDAARESTTVAKKAETNRAARRAKKASGASASTQASKSQKVNSKDSRASIPGWDQIAHPSDVFFSTTSAAPSEVDSSVSRETPKQESAGTLETTSAANSSLADAPSAEVKNDSEEGNSTSDVQLQEVAGAYLDTLALEEIEPNAYQPRSVFAEEELKELSDSIKEVGVLQPIVVRKRSDADAAKDGVRYELIMGERRLRASRLAGKTEIPAIVRTTEDSNMLRDALLENLHRVQLNPLEEAAAYEQMIEEFGLTQAQLSQSVSKSRPQVANTLRLLQLPGSVQKRVASGVLSAGHARALLALDSEEQMLTLAKRIVAEGLSVRSTEEIVALQKNDGTPDKPRKRSAQNYWKGSALPQKLGDRFDTKVTIRGTEQKGRIEITFASQEDLQRISDLLVGGESLKNSDADGWV